MLTVAVPIPSFRRAGVPLRASAPAARRHPRLRHRFPRRFRDTARRDRRAAPEPTPSPRPNPVPGSRLCSRASRRWRRASGPLLPQRLDRCAPDPRPPWPAVAQRFRPHARVATLVAWPCKRCSCGALGSSSNRSSGRRPDSCVRDWVLAVGVRFPADHSTRRQSSCTAAFRTRTRAAGPATIAWLLAGLRYSFLCSLVPDSCCSPKSAGRWPAAASFGVWLRFLDGSGTRP